MEILIVVVMVCVNAVFAGYEIALASVSVARLQSLVAQKTRGARSALVMKEAIERSLAVVQLGITLVGLLAGATGGASAADDIAPFLVSQGLSPTVANVLAIALVVVPLTALTIVVGELMPKLFALRNKEWVCLTLSPVMQFLSWSAWPMVWFLETSASGLMNLIDRIWRPGSHGNAKAEAAELQELRAIASMARTSRLIGAREENIILGAARIASRQVHEIILPADDIRMLSLETPLNKVLAEVVLDLHTRFPVSATPGDAQTIVGYVTFKDLASALRPETPERDLRDVLRDIPNLPATTSISAALEYLLKDRTHIALVKDESGRVLGMITLEDIVEELVGDIQDEHDFLPSYAIRSGQGWIVGGGISLPKLTAQTSVALSPSTTAQTLSQWICERLSDCPVGGEDLVDGTTRIHVRKIRRHRVLEAAMHTVESHSSSSTLEPTNSNSKPN